MAATRFTEKQVDPILDLRLYQLTGLERDKIKSEYDELLETIKDLLDILAQGAACCTIIKEELREIQDKVRHAAPHRDRAGRGRDHHGGSHRQRRAASSRITHSGFIKRTAVSAYRAQRRGGKGVIGMTTREGATEDEDGDFVEHLFTATHARLPDVLHAGRAAATSSGSTRFPR